MIKGPVTRQFALTIPYFPLPLIYRVRLHRLLVRLRVSLDPFFRRSSIRSRRRHLVPLFLPPIQLQNTREEADPAHEKTEKELHNLINRI